MPRRGVEGLDVRIELALLRAHGRPARPAAETFWTFARGRFPLS
jgi:hypothetical protein